MELFWQVIKMAKKKGFRYGVDPDRYCPEGRLMPRGKVDAAGKSPPQ
jgi:hypothetical protein